MHRRASQNVVFRWISNFHAPETIAMGPCKRSAVILGGSGRHGAPGRKSSSLVVEPQLDGLQNR
jgi:hypothetical protein